MIQFHPIRNQKLKQRSRPFTLLEIVIVLALISMIGGVASYSLSDLLAKHRAAAQVDELKELMQELQIEALALKSDMELSFTLDKQVCRLRSKTAEKILRDRTVELKGVRQLTFDKRAAGKIDLRIISTGRFEPQGVIGIERNNGSLWIDVRQPLAIKFSDKCPEAFLENIPVKPKKKE